MSKILIVLPQGTTVFQPNDLVLIGSYAKVAICLTSKEAEDVRIKFGAHPNLPYVGGQGNELWVGLNNLERFYNAIQ